MRLFEATFTTDATDSGDDLYVSIPGRDSGAAGFGPVVWAPHGDRLPQDGDEALVAESDQGRWWVIQWISS